MPAAALQSALFTSAILLPVRALSAQPEIRPAQPPRLGTAMGIQPAGPVQGFMGAAILQRAPLRG